MTEKLPDLPFRQATSDIERELALDLDGAARPFSVANAEYLQGVRFILPEDDFTISDGALSGAVAEGETWHERIKKAVQIELITNAGFRGGFPSREWPLHLQHFARIAEIARDEYANGSPSVDIELIALPADAIGDGPHQPEIAGAGPVTYPHRVVNLANGISARMARVATRHPASVVAYSFNSR